MEVRDAGRSGEFCAFTPTAPSGKRFAAMTTHITQPDERRDRLHCTLPSGYHRTPHESWNALWSAIPVDYGRSTGGSSTCCWKLVGVFRQLIAGQLLHAIEVLIRESQEQLLLVQSYAVSPRADSGRRRGAGRPLPQLARLGPLPTGD